jgi:hypothetical protein
VIAAATKLTELMAVVRARGAPWTEPQVIEADHDTLRAAWRVSNDPHAMVLLLAALYPARDQLRTRCTTLVETLSFYPPVARLAERQAGSQPGMNYNGPARSTFLALASHVAVPLAELPAADRAEFSRRLCVALREEIDDPFDLPA